MRRPRGFIIYILSVSGLVCSRIIYGTARRRRAEVGARSPYVRFSEVLTSSPPPKPPI